MQNRYNPVIVQVYVAFMFGLILPVLFPLTLVGILIKYFIERLTITYFYRQPPMYNKRLSQEAINILKFAPILMFLISYWALGNVQIFENRNRGQVININNQSDPHHNLFNFDKIDQTHLVLLYMIVFILSQNVNLLNSKDLEEREIDEDLGSYWKNLNGID